MIFAKEIIIGVLALSLAGGAFGAFHKWKTDMQTAANAAAVLQVKVQEETKARIAVEKSFKLQRSSYETLEREKAELRQQLDDYLSIFKRHDLTKLSRAKPGLIESRINAATEKLFKELEDETN